MEIPNLERDIGLHDLVAYGAATWDWHRLHYDQAFAERSGMRGPVVDGQMFGALLAEQVLRALDRNARVTRLHFRNRAPVYAGDRLICEAKVLEESAESLVVEQTIRVGETIVVAPAGTELVFD